MNRPGFSGAVLAGGESRRMGQDKATLLLNGEPLWQRQVRILRAVGAAPVGVVRRPDQPPLPLSADTPLWHDKIAGIGPLAGLHAALEACQTEHLMVVATDMPRIQADWFRKLAASCAPGIGAVAQHENQLFEPMGAIYPRQALAIAQRCATAGVHSLQNFVHALHAQGLLSVISLSASEASNLISWNRAEDWGHS